ncbi:aminotransferase class V-fold PLP-dependent enzyme [Nocardia sp. NPDC049190]|uniref:aminotransferase class V-fold PLP-dependent enzyme n=1 Tax=Nocardia sp. NPDC049190 TaxID=3155650 RepID=UPI00340D1454
MAVGGAPWEAFERQVDEARSRFAALIGARDDQVAVMPNASVGAYQVASTRDWSARERIVTTTAEFPSIAHVWLAQRACGAEVVYAAPAAESYAGLINRHTSLVSVPLISYYDAARPPVTEVVRAARSVGAEVFVDAYQAVGVEPVDVGRLDCDFLVAGTSKYLLGLPGLAFLYTRSPERTDHTPRLTGWFGRVDPFAFDPYHLDFSTSATRFETGTAAVPACYAANAGLRLIAELNPTTVRAHVRQLVESACERLIEQGEQVRALPPTRRGAHIGLIDSDPAGLARRLTERGVVVSPRGDLIRVAFHYYSDIEDITALCAALRADRARVGRLPAPSPVDPRSRLSCT